MADLTEANEILGFLNRTFALNRILDSEKRIAYVTSGDVICDNMGISYDS